MDAFHLVLYSIVGFQLFLLLLILQLGRRTQHARTELGRRKTCFLVTAHPDDEAMFFVPFILGVKAEGCAVTLLCLTNGGSAGRAAELRASCEVLGVDRVEVLDFKEKGIFDSMSTIWDENTLKDILARLVPDSPDCSAVTFDERGVSGHANHVSLFHACRKLSFQLKHTRFYALRSPGLLRKYLLPLSMLAELLAACAPGGGPHHLLFLNLRPAVTWRCMRCHRSQFVWFRKLFVLFSSLGYLNALRRLD